MCMALGCDMVPDHSTIVAFISSMRAEIVAIFRDMLLVCAEQNLLLRGDRLAHGQA